MEQQRLFFSYARADGQFALKLATDLRKAGVALWLDQLDIGAGERWDRSIERALEEHPALLVILSPDSVASTNVMDEVSYALEEGKRLVPVLHKECKLPFRLRRIQHVDLSQDYKAGFSELLHELGLGGKQQFVTPSTPSEPPTQAPDPETDPYPPSAQRKSGLRKLLPLLIGAAAIVGAVFAWRAWTGGKPPPGPTGRPEVTQGTGPGTRDEPAGEERATEPAESTPGPQSSGVGTPTLRPTRAVVGKLALPAWVILDETFEKEGDVRSRVLRLKSAFDDAGYYWIPDVSRGGARLFQSYVGPLADRASAAKAVCEYQRKITRRANAALLTAEGRQEVVHCSDR